jgi:nuclear transport factor 2 (NTF2) superfamily protein
MHGILVIPRASRSPTQPTAAGETVPNSCRAARPSKNFLTRRWNRELDYRLIKEVWAFRENRISVRFAYEWRDDGGYWFRSYGNENWEFDEHGLMLLRIASINDVPIKESERKYRWPLGRRPDDHPSLSDLGL